MSSPDALYDEAVALKDEGKADEAIAKLHAILEDAPDHMLTHCALSAFYNQLDQSGQAVEHARKVCELDPDDPFSYIALSMICRKADLREEAEDAMAKAMEKQWAAARND